MSNKLLIQSVRRSLSAARLLTYETASSTTDDEDLSALNLYSWNASVSAALLAPLHICEVVLRNGISEAIEAVYGPSWPWSSGFERSLPDPMRDWSPRKELVAVRRRIHTTGKIIPELKFVFWQKLMTQRHDPRLWDPYLRQIFQNLDPTASVQDLRRSIYLDLEALRLLRNRIAHHEPIFSRDLNADYQRMVSLVDYRCNVTASWMQTTCSDVPLLIASRP